jgi:hypothetical protein
MIWLLLLPFRLLFGVVFGLLALPFVILFLPLVLLLWLPFAILRLALKLIVGIVVLPIVAVVTFAGLLIGGVALAAAIFVPLIPLLLLAFVIWAVWRMTQGPAKAGHDVVST